jgi:hypothetical protein
MGDIAGDLGKRGMGKEGDLLLKALSSNTSHWYISSIQIKSLFR